MERFNLKECSILLAIIVGIGLYLVCVGTFLYGIREAVTAYIGG